MNIRTQSRKAGRMTVPQILARSKEASPRPDFPISERFLIDTKTIRNRRILLKTKDCAHV
jgi:hypothetical protein